MNNLKIFTLLVSLCFFFVTESFSQAIKNIFGTLNVISVSTGDTISFIPGSPNNKITSNNLLQFDSSVFVKISVDTSGVLNNTKQIYLDSASFIKFVEFLTIIKADTIRANYYEGLGDFTIGKAGENVTFNTDTTYVNGNVGIGTYTVTEKLEVNGNAKIDSVKAIHYGGQSDFTIGKPGTDIIIGADTVVINGSVGIGEILTPLTILHANSSTADTVAIITIENTAGDFQIFRTDTIPETVVTGSIGDLVVDGTNGILHLKQSGTASKTGWQVIGGLPSFKSYTFVAKDASTGENFQAGFYIYSATDANLDEGSLTVTHGGANHPYAAHAFVASGGNGSTDGSDLVLTVSGTSILDDGTRTVSDSEVIVATATSSAVNSYYETTKKWLGTITFTLSSSGGSTFSYDFNYGFTKYEDFGNRNFTITDFESVGVANANDGGFNIELLHHKSSGWTYAASGFVAGTSALLSMNTIHSTEQDIDSGEHFAFKRAGLSVTVKGDDSEGIIVRVTTGVNNSVSYMDTHVGILMR